MATVHYTLKARDVAAFEQALHAWAAPVADSTRTASTGTQRPLGPVARDGKALHGIHGKELPGVRLVALYDVRASVVLAHKGGQDTR